MRAKPVNENVTRRHSLASLGVVDFAATSSFAFAVEAGSSGKQLKIMKHTDRQRILRIAGFSCVFLLSTISINAARYYAIQNKCDNTELHIVPAPGVVQLDGDLKEWDTSGAILMSLDEASRDSYAMRVMAMYDAGFLYLAGRAKDPTPMLNTYGFGTQVGMAWNADAIQIRLLSNPDMKSNASNRTGGKMPDEEQHFINHITLWYSTQDKLAGYYVDYGLKHADPALNPAGVEGAYRADTDGMGYAFEYRIPWSVLRSPRPLAAGDKVQMQFQVNWGNDRGTEMRSGLTDLRNPASVDLGYMGPSSWGTATFEKSGCLAETTRKTEERAAGHIPVTFSLETDAKVSLAVSDEAGRILRTGIGAQPFHAGTHTWMWDGLDDGDQPVPAGAYTVKLLTHGGIGQKYICDIGVSGTPPYQTEEGTGGWAGDYRYPQVIAVAGDTVVLGTASAEAAPAAIRTNLEGRKLGSIGATGHAAVLYQGFGYMLNTGGKVTRFNLGDSQLAPFSSGRPEAVVAAARAEENKQDWGNRSWQMLAIAVAGNQLVVSSRSEDKLYLMDLASGEPRGEAALTAPFGLASAPGGELYAVSGNTVGRYDLKTQRFTQIIGDLDQPQHLACDAGGDVYVSLAGETMQVWRISPTGVVQRKYGKGGGRPALGRFDPAGMLKPWGIGVDKNGRLWVAEADRQPKRYSVWNEDGTLWKEFFGSLDYSTTAYVNPEQPEFIHAQGVRYLVDFAKGTWQPDATILQPRTEEGVVFSGVGSHGGAAIVNYQGRKFLISGGKGLAIYEEVGGAYLPRLTSYVQEMVVVPSPNKKSKPKKTKTPMLWIDDNNDGRVQLGECRQAGAAWTYYWTPVVDGSLNLYRSSGATWTGHGGKKTVQPYSVVRWDFLGFNERGGLKYGDPSQSTIVATDADGGAVAEVRPEADGSAFYALVSGGTLDNGQRAQGSGHRVVKFSADGGKLWEYQNVHCAFAWTSGTYTPGFLVSAMCFVRGHVPGLVGITGYYGQYFLLDAQDGLFIDALSQDQRSAYTLDETMVLTENFNGTLFRHPGSGKTYLLGGDADCRLWELTGLEGIKRQTMAVAVSAEQATIAAANGERNSRIQLAVLEKNTGRKSVALRRLAGAAADGKDMEWVDVPTLAIGEDPARQAQVQFGYDDTHLYARFRVTTTTPFHNTPTDFRQLFKTGSALEICLATDTAMRQVKPQNIHPMQVGDLRVVIARRADGTMVATRYRPVIKSAKKPDAAYFETPSAGRESFDEIATWDDLPMAFRAEKDSYAVEVALPWGATGITPAPGLRFLADAGVIYGNTGGTRNALRAMWTDRTPEVGVNNDIPTESRLHPNGWGLITLEP